MDLPLNSLDFSPLPSSQAGVPPPATRNSVNIIDVPESSSENIPLSHFPSEPEIIPFSGEVLSKGAQDWSFCLVGYYIGRRPLYEAILGAMRKTWSLKGQNATNYLLSGEHLSTSQYLIEGNTKLIIQNDCDLVLYNSTKRIWNSGTINEGLGCYLTLQENGKLVILDNKNDVVWDTKPIKPNGKYILIVQRDYKAVIYGPKFWASNIIGSDDVAVATALNGPMGVSGAKANMMMKMGKIIEVMSDE